ncbi:MAG: hypothetical protein AAGG07_10475 [Planctomycetota bacterium]
MRIAARRAMPALIVAIAVGAPVGDACAEPKLEAAAESHEGVTNRVERGGGIIVDYSYQGRLDDGGVPANGVYDVRFYLYTGAGTFVTGQTQTIAVTDGLFSTQIPISPDTLALNATNDLELELQVRPTGTGAYTILSPREPLTWTPLAAYADSSNIANRALIADDIEFPLVASGDFGQPSVLVDNTGSAFAAIVGQQTPAAGLTVGSLGTTSGGVVGETENTSLNAILGRKIQAEGSENDVPAVRGVNAVDDFYGVGVEGVGGWRGVTGFSTGTGAGSYTGVLGNASSGNASASGSFIGVRGSANGLLGQNTAYGVLGEASGGETNYAGYFGAGDVVVENDLKREYTSNTLSNALPVAYGSVDFDGTINGGSGNFTVSTTTTGIYDIAIADLTYSTNRHSAMITPITPGSSPALYRTASGSSFAGALRVRIWDSAPALTSGEFHFVVFGPSEADARPAARRGLMVEGAEDTAPMQPERLVRPQSEREAR